MVSMLLISTVLALTISAAEARPRVSGPVSANLLEVIDGDTLLVEAMPWPEHRIITYVRLRGIDAAELRSPCPNLRLQALEAKELLRSFIPVKAELELRDITGDKYYGRIVAAVRLKDGVNLSEAMVSAGMATPYEGGGKPKLAC